MDIAKIRKKALSQDAAKGKPAENPEEKPVPCPADEEKEQAAAEETVAPLEETGGIPTEAGDEVLADITDADEVSSEDAVEMVELLTFNLSNEEYAFGVPEVEEVIRSQLIAFVPTMPGYVLGVTSIRGKIIPVIDLKTRLNLQGMAPDANDPGDNPETEMKRRQERKILIVDGPKGLIGATIDKVVGVVRLPLSEILQPPGHLDETGLKFIEGIVVQQKRFISIIHSEAAMDIEIG
jgi:purine-binding chemotaxis protein CheW